jgi:hypothetical protein
MGFVAWQAMVAFLSLDANEVGDARGKKEAKNR